MSDELKAAALEYAAQGYAVLPLCSPVLELPCTCGAEDRRKYAQAHTAAEGMHVGCILGGLCDSPGKHPLVEGGHKCASTDTALVEEWWQRWPGANVGLLVGERFDVLDADRALPESVLAAWPARTMPMETTGRGGHYYFAPQPPGLRPPAKLSFGEWKSSGYVVAAPSLHRTGARYKWHGGAGIADGEPGGLTKGLRQALIKAKFDPKQARPEEDAEALLERALGTLRDQRYPVEEVADGQYQARCPAHAPMSDPEQHSSTSLGLKLQDDHLLIHCFAGCSYKDIREALGIAGAVHVRHDREAYIANIPDAEAEIGGILDDLAALFRDYLVAPHHSYFHLLALWAAHTWVYQHFQFTPRLRVGSATKRSGKTLISELLRPVVRNGKVVVAPSAASIYRGGQRTLLLDDVDSWWGSGDDGGSTLSAVLLSGFGRDGSVERVEKDGDGTMVVVEHPTFMPVAYNGIQNDKLPDTLLDRSITLLMRRKTEGEVVKRFRTRVYEQRVARLAARLEAWAQRSGEMLGARVDGAGESGALDIPGTDNDRAVNIWEPLKAIAEQAGGDWPARCDAAAVTTLREVEQYGGGQEPEGVTLLGHIRGIFAGRGDPEVLPTQDVRNALIDEADWPWGEYGRTGKAISARRIADLLAPFKVKSFRRHLEPADEGYERGRAKYGPMSWLLKEVDAAARVYVGNPLQGSADTDNPDNPVHDGDRSGTARDGAPGPGSGGQGFPAEGRGSDAGGTGASAAGGQGGHGGHGPSGKDGGTDHGSLEDRILAAVAEHGPVPEKGLHERVGGGPRFRRAVDALLGSGELSANGQGLVLGEAL